MSPPQGKQYKDPSVTLVPRQSVDLYSVADSLKASLLEILLKTPFVASDSSLTLDCTTIYKITDNDPC